MYRKKKFVSLTTGKLEIRRIKMWHHFRKVFLVTPTRAALTFSMQYCFRCNSAHNKCCGIDRCGRVLDNFSQIETHTDRVVPKKTLNFLYPTVLLPSLSWRVILCPRFQKISLETIINILKTKSREKTNKNNREKRRCCCLLIKQCCNIFWKQSWKSRGSKKLRKTSKYIYFE